MTQRETRERFHPERLGAHHVTSEFDCGVPSLNAWLARSALTAQSKGVAAVEVWADGDRVLASFAISPTSVSGAGMPASASTGLEVIPAYLLGKLALDRSLHGRGLGARLLTQALRRVLAAADRAGGRLLVVDAIDDGAAEFYRHFGFIPIEGTNRLYMKVATIRATGSS